GMMSSTKSKSKLVPVQKLVTRNGRQHLQTYYVSLEESKKMGYQHHTKKKQGKDALTKLLRKVRKQLGSDIYRDMIKANGITWEPSEHSGVNTMRATMAAYKWLMEGNNLDIEKRTTSTREPKLVINRSEERRVGKECRSKS